MFAFPVSEVLVKIKFGSKFLFNTVVKIELLVGPAFSIPCVIEPDLKTSANLTRIRIILLVCSL